MGLETFTYITSLNSSNPVASDPKSQGDDHLRGIKAALLASWPNINAAVTVTPTELNYLSGVSSAIQTQINAKGAITGQAWTGTHTFPTQTAGDNSTKAATTAYVDQRAFSSALPTQTSNAGKWLYTDGVNASWQFNPVYPSVAYSLNAL